MQLPDSTGCLPTLAQGRLYAAYDVATGPLLLLCEMQQASS